MLTTSSCSISGRPAELAVDLGCGERELLDAMPSLKTSGLAEVTERNGVITIVCRRLQREFKLRKDNALRQERWRNKPKNNAPSKNTPVASGSGSGSGSGKQESKKRQEITDDRAKVDAALQVSAQANAAEDLAQCELKDLPAHLNTARMQKQWQVWMNVRRAHRNKPKHWAVMFNTQIDMLEKLSEPDAFESLSASIRNGWQGLFPPKTYGTGYTGRNNAENPRNFGVVRGPTDHAAAVQRSIEREAKKAEAKRLAEEMAAAQYDPPADHGSGGSGL